MCEVAIPPELSRQELVNVASAAMMKSMILAARLKWVEIDGLPRGYESKAELQEHARRLMAVARAAHAKLKGE